MPNWCENNIIITADTPNDLVKIVRRYFLEKGGSNGSLELDFNRIVPEPETINSCPPKYIINNNSNNIQKLKSRGWFNWYDWHCDYWGTKWNASSESWFDIDSIDEILKNGIKRLYIYTQTAWSPCVPIVQALQRQNPNIFVEMQYYEPGMCFAGEIMSDGTENNYEFDHDDPDFRKWTIDNGFETEEYYQEYDAENAKENN